MARRRGHNLALALSRHRDACLSFLADPVTPYSARLGEQVPLKLLLILNAVVRDQISWQPNRVPTAGEAWLSTQYLCPMSRH